MSSSNSNNPDDLNSASGDDSEPPLPSRSFGKLGWSLILVGILVAGGVLAYIVANTGPTAERSKKEGPRAPKVEITQVEQKTNDVHLRGYGNVEPARRIKLVPQVSGKIVDRSDSFHPGGFFDKGDTILQIERDDYQLRVLQRKSELQQAQTDLTLAQSNQAVAKDEYQRIRDQLNVTNPSVILKEPQIKAAKASVRKARSALEMARLNLRRTSITAPFDAHVTERMVEKGMSVSKGQALATLVGINEYWMKLSLPVSHVKWLLNDNGNLNKDLPVRIYNKTAWSESTYRTAYVKDLVRELETKGRMAQVLVAIEDPLALEIKRNDKPPMMVGAYVKGVIEADTIPNSVEIDRDLLRNGDHIWVVNSDGTLDIRDVTIAFRGEETVIVSDGLESGDRVVRTDLSSAVDGMAVEVKNGTTKQVQEKNPKNKHAQNEPSNSNEKGT